MKQMLYSLLLVMAMLCMGANSAWAQTRNLDKESFIAYLADYNNEHDSYELIFAESYEGEEDGIEVGEGVVMYISEDRVVIAPDNSEFDGIEIHAPEDCSGLFQDLNVSSITFTNFFTAVVQDMSSMFNNCQNLQSLDLSGFNTASVTNMSQMFGCCSSLQSLDLSGFDTEGVENMSQMFFGCDGLQYLDLSGFDTQGVTNMSEMFGGCSSLQYLDLSGFNTAKVTNMEGMFSDCTGLKKIYVSDKFVVTGIIEEDKGENMFYGCSLLVGEKGTVFSQDDIDKSYAHIDGGDGNEGYFSVRNMNATTSLTAADFHDDGFMDDLCVRRTVYSPVGGYYSMSFSDGISVILLYKLTAEGEVDKSSLGYTEGLSYATRIEPGAVYFVEGYCRRNTAPASATMTTEFTPDQVMTLKFEDDEIGSDGIDVFKSFQISAEGYYTISSSISDLAIAVSSYIISEEMDEERIDIDDVFEDMITGGLGSVTCQLEPGTYTLYSQYDQNAEVDVTIQRVLAASAVELPSLELGNQTVKLVQVTSLDMQYSFTPEKSGDYKFTLSEWDQLTHTIMSNTSTFSVTSLVGYDLDNGTMYADNLEAGKTYYLIIGQGQSSHYTSQLIDKEVTLTVSYAGTKKAVYNSTDHTLIFTHDAVDYTGEGITVMAIPNMDKKLRFDAPKRANADATDSETTTTFPWQESTTAVAAMKQDVTKAIFDPSFADVIPTTCESWFSGYANMASIEGFEYLNTEEAENMDNMFSGCAALQSLTLGNHFDMQEVESYTDMFAGASNLKTLTLKALPYLKEGTFDTQFSGEGVTVKYEIGDVKIVRDYNCPAPTVAPTYTRNMAAGTQWGTLVLPFPIVSDNEAQLYEMTGVSSTAITFSPVTSVEAHKPCVFKKKKQGATSVTFTATEVTALSFSDLDILTQASVNGLAIWGTYCHKYLTDGYFIAQDQFWYADVETDVYPFRAWFEGTLPSASGASLRIEVADDAEGIQLIDSEEGTLYMANGKCHDLMGRQIGEERKGLVIENGRVIWAH